MSGSFGDLAEHPEWGRLLRAIQILLDNHRDAVLTEASRADLPALRLAEGRRQGVALVFEMLKKG